MRALSSPHPRQVCMEGDRRRPRPIRCFEGNMFKPCCYLVEFALLGFVSGKNKPGYF